MDTPDMEYVSCSTALNLEMSLLKEKTALTAQACWSGDGINGNAQPGPAGLQAEQLSCLSRSAVPAGSSARPEWRAAAERRRANDTAN